MNLFTNQKQTHRLKEQTYGYLVWADIVREFGTDMYILLYLNNQTERNDHILNLIGPLTYVIWWLREAPLPSHTYYHISGYLKINWNKTTRLFTIPQHPDCTISSPLPLYPPATNLERRKREENVKQEWGRKTDDDVYAHTKWWAKMKFIGFHSSTTSQVPGAKNICLVTGGKKCRNFHFILQTPLFCAFFFLFLLPSSDFKYKRSF